MSQKISLSRYLVEQQRSKGRIPSQLRLLLEVVARACKSISHAVNKGALGGVLGSADIENVQGEIQKKLDIIANEVLIEANEWGGHLAAMLLATDWKKVNPKLPAHLSRKAISISGLYDLEPIRKAPFIQASLHLTPKQVRQASPAQWASPRQRTLYTLAGAQESAEFLRQNQLIQQRWGARTVPVCEALPDCNHFSILTELTRSGSRLNDLMRQLVAL